MAEHNIVMLHPCGAPLPVSGSLKLLLVHDTLGNTARWEGEGRLEGQHREAGRKGIGAAYRGELRADRKDGGAAWRGLR